MHDSEVSCPVVLDNPKLDTALAFGGHEYAVLFVNPEQRVLFSYPPDHLRKRKSDSSGHKAQYACHCDSAIFTLPFPAAQNSHQVVESRERVSAN